MCWLIGIATIKGKHKWWYANNGVHGTEVEGPYVANREDQFVLRFILDTTPTGGERMQMTEVALFTVEKDKMKQEEYLYLAGRIHRLPDLRDRFTRSR